jgi:hypothetical protein
MDRAEQERALWDAVEEFLAGADPSQHTFDLPDQIVAAIVELEASAEEVL